MSHNSPSSEEKHPLQDKPVVNVEQAALLVETKSCKCCAAPSTETAEVCPMQLQKVHAAYLAGRLANEIMHKIDKHLLICRRCENTWDALTSALEDGMTAEYREDPQEDDCPRGRTFLLAMLSLVAVLMHGLFPSHRPAFA